tara:strand:- start:174 stop:275 length:102 start_codon:yes stop_codon:yes gene_type:complete
MQLWISGNPIAGKIKKVMHLATPLFTISNQMLE